MPSTDRLQAAPLATLPSGQRDPALEVQDVTITFGGVRALDHVSLAVEPGIIMGLIGPNGAGKTTLFNVISGFLRPDSGSVLLRGKPLNGMPPHEIAHAGVGRLFQDIRVFRRLSLEDQLSVARSRDGGDRLWRSLFPLRRGSSLDRPEIAQLLARFGLETKARVLGDELSLGEQKLLGFCRVLAGEPSLLLLDEPGSGVSLELLARIQEAIRAEASKGRSVLIIEHDLDLVRTLCDRVLLMQAGRIVETGTTRDVLDGETIVDAFHGR
jgi:ABC-type branched-subunit amino acid transport system ATPase component